MAQPARHSERAEKLYPPAIQSSASLHIGRGSNRRWMKVQWQVKSDTLGKDSELASTLAQGKPVIAFVQKPAPNAAEKLISSLGEDVASQKRSILSQLKVYRPSSAWEDAEVQNWLRDPDKMPYKSGVRKLQAAMAEHFKNRDGLLRDTHPLGIQMNLQTGVANGVLVVNTVDQCARLVRCLLLRQMAFEIDTQQKPEGEYLLLR